jgi:hypothetical protein
MQTLSPVAPPTRGVCTSLSSSRPVASSGGRTRALAASAKIGYLQFVWGLCFGLIATIATPVVAIAAIVLGIHKTVHDWLRTRTK